MYCFDPRARGRVPVDLLAASADKYGYILAGSNNSRNGEWDASLGAIHAMWNDTHTRFAIDKRRVYACGFSGGARLATWMALNVKGVAGVLIAGGGFVEPVRDVPFAVFGCAGSDDFNWPELKELDAALDGSGTPHRVMIFEGGHSWPPAETAARGFEWLELHAMRSGARGRDERLAAAALEERLSRIAAAPPEGQWVELSAITEDFDGLLDVSGYRRRAEALRQTAAVRRMLKQERQEFERYEDAVREMQQALREPADMAQRQEAAARLTELVWRLRRQADASRDSPGRRVARRILSGFAVGLIDQGGELLERKRFDAAVRSLSIAADMQPQWASAWFELARAHALDGNAKRAIEALGRAVDCGLRDAARIGSEPAFEKQRGSPGFAALLDRAK